VNEEWEAKQLAVAKEHESLVSDLQSALDAAEQRSQEATEARTAAEVEIAEVIQARDELATTNAQLHSQVMELQEAMEDKLKAAEVFVGERIKEVKHTAVAQEQTHAEEKGRLTALLEDVEAERGRLSGELEDVEAERGRLNGELASALRRCEAVELELKTRGEASDRLEEELTVLHEQLRQVQFEKDELMSDHEKRQSDDTYKAELQEAAQRQVGSQQDHTGVITHLRKFIQFDTASSCLTSGTFGHLIF
jgi:chromosome segregation ATPase